eukprot:3085529-Rhodomonas_salina.2
MTVTAKLSNLLYRDSKPPLEVDSAFRFWATLSTWMIEYWFKAIDTDKMLFRSRSADGTIMIIAFYVDAGLVAHNNDEAYATFLKALATD